MDFSSDNTAGASPEVLAAIARANEGREFSYGDDTWTANLTKRLSAVFEREVAAFPVISGTAANSLAIATFTPPHGAVLCHTGAHIIEHECSAPEFYSGGARLVPVAGPNGKIDVKALKAAIAHLPKGSVHNVQPATISITQSTEVGTAYSIGEIAEISSIAKKHGLALHMDGARFANALVHQKCSPADLTWRAGVDVMSFGLTKDGALTAEAVVFFDPKNVRDFDFRRKRGGHQLSKMRFVSAQWAAMLENDLWLKNARHANAMAQDLAAGLRKIEGVTLDVPVEANAVFPTIPASAFKKLEEAGALFFPWTEPKEGRIMIRLVCSFLTSQTEVSTFVGLMQKVLDHRA